MLILYQRISNSDFLILETDDWMCSESHKVRVDDKKRYFSCMGCKRYVMGQSSIHCRECSRYYNALQRYNIGQSSLYCGRKSLDKKNFRYCLDCKNVNEDIDSGKKFSNAFLICMRFLNALTLIKSYNVNLI